MIAHLFNDHLHYFRKRDVAFTTVINILHLFTNTEGIDRTSESNEIFSSAIPLKIGRRCALPVLYFLSNNNTCFE